MISANLPVAVAALGASALLLFSAVSRPLAAVALVASGVEVALALGALRVQAPGVPLRLTLALALAIPGLLAWLRATSKPAVSAASVLSFVGVLQVVWWTVTRF